MKRKRILIILSVLILTLSFLAVTVVSAHSTMASGQSHDRQQGAPGVPNLAYPLGPLTEQVQDGGFETGTPNAFWTEASTNFGTPLCTAGACGTGGGTGPHSGSWWTWFGGITGVIEEGSVSQSVMIPVGTTTITWWQECPVTVGSGSDYMELTVDGNQIYQILGNDASCGVVGYAMQSADISAYADGGSHTIAFHSETFAGAGPTNFFVDDVSIDAPDAVPAIVLTKTVGTTAGVCATTDSITVPAGMGGTDVYYCYEVMNTGDVTLTLHNLVDDQLGTLLTGEPMNLPPGGTIDTVSAGFTFSATITQTTVNSATWTAFNNSQETASASDTATVTQGNPTGVSLTGFGDGGPSATPIWLGALGLLIVGLGLLLRRKLTD